jgi:CBS domain containing-hemolysin-like protein
MSEPYATLLRLLAVVVLVAINGFFVATEFALVSIRRTRVEALVERRVAGAAHVQQALGDLDRFIAATQLGITMASLGLGWMGEPAVASLLDDLLGWVPAQIDVELIAGIIAFIVITGLAIIFGELAPKSIALQRTERTALLVVAPVSLFAAIFRPAIALLNGAGAAAVRLLGIDPAIGHQRSSLHSPEEIELLVEQSAQGGALPDLERRMIHGVFDVGDRLARQAMVPRTQIQGIPAEADLEEVVACARASRHSRLPVYEQDLDHVVGVLHLRDLLLALDAVRTGAACFCMQALIRPILAVPETLTLDEVLLRLRQAETGLTLVVDEYGGTAGILTIADILEEIVGEVRDEFDPSGPAELAPQQDGSWLIDGLVPLDEVDEQLGTHLGACASEDGAPLAVDTLAGLILARLGRMAVAGDAVTVPGDPPVQVQVEEMVGRRIVRVRVRQGHSGVRDV